MRFLSIVAYVCTACCAFADKATITTAESVVLSSHLALAFAEQNDPQKLAELGLDSKRRSKFIVLRMMTVAGNYGATRDWSKRLRETAKNCTENVKEAVEDFIGKNRESVSVEELKPGGVPVRIQSEAEYREFFSRDPDLGWRRFWQTYPESGGLFGVSRVGFSKDGSIAVFYSEESGDSLGGEGRFYVMRFSDHRWERVTLQIGWHWVS